MELTELIEKHGEKIAETLRIAGAQVYDKLIWYTRVSGIITLVELALGAVLLIIHCIITHKIIRKLGLYEYLGDGNFMFGWLMSAVVFMIVMLVASSIVDPITKIFFTEYYLINQVINAAK